MNALFDQFRAIGAGRLTAIFGLAAGVAAALMYFSGALGSGNQTLLYANLEPAVVADTLEILDQNNIQYEVGNGGTAIYVPSDRADTARVLLADNGPLTGATVGYDIFDRSDSLGQTSFVQNINAKRALEGELARTIQSLDFVRSARVHLNIPERRVFERDRQDPTAAVTINARGRLNSEQIRVIRNLVASGAGLDVNDISIADSMGRLLASASDDETATGLVMDERRSAIETQLRDRIMRIVEDVVGAGSASVQVSAELNRESLTSSSQARDPNSQVLLSRTRSEDNSRDYNSSSRVSASENLPDAADGAPGADAQPSTQETSNEQVSYDYTTTTTTQVIEAGAISRLSVAVAVDGIVTLNEDGTTSWAERPIEEIERIQELVQSAMGYVNVEGGRQDSVTVRQFEFARNDPMLGSEASGGFEFNKNDIMRVAEILVLLITTVLVIFLVARPLVKGANGVAVPQGLALAGAGAPVPSSLDTAPVPNALPTGGGGAKAASPAALPEPSPSITDGIDIEKIDGQVKASSVKKVASIVDQHPEESISILRTWLHEG